MLKHYTYLLVDVCCIFFPFVFSFHPRIKFNLQLRFALVPALFTATFFLIWDILFTVSGVWSFNPQYVCGLYLFNLPLEEYLFFFCIPYACLFTYYSLGLFFNFSRYAKTAESISWGLIGFLTAVALTHLPQLYTSVTFLLLAAFLTLLTIRRVSFLPAFYISFLLILLPFFISNGILTGTGPDQPVVRYNDHYNLGVRMFTIPVEDTFYGMLLMLMNVAGFEQLKSRK